MAILFACFAYWVIPKGEMDLTRYFEQVAYFGTMDWNTFVSTILNNDFLFIQKLLFYFVGRSGDYHLLPAIVIFISYFIMFYMMTDYANRTNAKSKELLLALLFLLSVMPFITLVSNVRNILAFSILSFAIYREFVQKKKNILTLLIYIIPLFIHVSSLALILIKLIAQRSSRVTIKNIIIYLIVSLTSFIILSNPEIFVNLPVIGEYVSSFIRKAVNYLTDSTSIEYINVLQQRTFSKLQKLYFVGTVIFLLIIMRIKPKDDMYYKFEYYYRYVSFIVIACFPIILTVYFRFTMAVLMFSFVVILYRINSIKHRDWKALVIICFFIIMLGGLVQQTLFFNSLAYIDQMIFNVASRSIFNMFNQ